MFTFADPRTSALIDLLRQHPQGVTSIEIAAIMSPPMTPRTLQRSLKKLVFAGLLTRRGSGATVRYFAGPGRVALLVKKRIPKPIVPPAVPPPPPPVPEQASNLPPKFRRLFDRMAPKIIELGFGDEGAMHDLGYAAVAERFSDDDCNDFIIAALNEFDVLQRDPTIAKYHLRPDRWDNWRPRWCKDRDLAE